MLIAKYKSTFALWLYKKYIIYDSLGKSALNFYFKLIGFHFWNKQEDLYINYSPLKVIDLSLRILKSIAIKLVEKAKKVFFNVRLS